MFTLPTSVRQWGNGLVAAVVGGAATAGSSWMGLVMAKGVGLDVPALNWKALGIILITGAATNFFAYLKQSPIPTTVEQTRVTVTKETTKPTEEDK